MSERKVLNKYYPPDFDPSKIPKLKGAKVNRQWSIRIMAPFNMRCNTCGEYIYKGKKFNSKKETVEDENYLGLHIFRFYIKCPRCVAEIAFKTDPEKTDYSLEAGATRNFEAAKTAEEMAKKEAAAIEEEEANNPMKVLENRTKQSMQEMEMIETLEELKEMNTRHARIDYSTMLVKYKIYEEQLAKLQVEEDEKLISSLFSKDADMVVKRLNDDDTDDQPPTKKLAKGGKATDILTQAVSTSSSSKSSVSLSGLVKPKKSLAGLVKPKSSLNGLVKPKSSLSGLVKPKSSPSSLVKPKAQATEAKTPEKDAGVFVRPKNPDKSFVKPKLSDTENEPQTVVFDARKAPKQDSENASQSSVEKEKTLKEAAPEKTQNVAALEKTENVAAPVEEKKEAKVPSKDSSAGKSTSLGGLGLLGSYSDSESGDSE